jgi:DNA polymerase-3 subunit gamma/tau
VEEGRLLDMIEIDAASNRGIDEIRDLREKVGFRPGEARVKFYIIDEVHMLTDPAFNALLKTLEEPPSHVIFVLATTEPHKIPATIVSRCQRFDFRRIPLSEITRWLAHIAETEGLKVEPAALEYIARQGGGSMRDAISLLDQLTAYGSDVITLAQVQAVLGAVASQAVIDLADSLIEGDLARGLDVINRVIGEGAEPRQFTREFVEYLRGLLLLKMGDGAHLLRASVSEETLTHMQEQVSRLSPRMLLRATRLFNTAAQEMKAGFLPQLPLELAFAESVVDEAAPEVPPPTQPRTREVPPASSTPPSSSTAPGAALRPAPVAPPQQDAPPSAPPTHETVRERRAPPVQPIQPAASGTPESQLSLEAVSAKWQDILTQLRQNNKMVEALMRSVRLVGLEDNRVIVEASSDLLKGRIEQQASKSFVEQSIRQVTGVTMGLRCVLKGEYQPRPQRPAVSSTPAGAPESALAEQDESAHQPADVPAEGDAKEDPMIQEAINLGAKIRNVD